MADIGAVGPVTNVGPNTQSIPGPMQAESTATWALEHSEQCENAFRYTLQLGGFCFLIRRDVVDDIGGFDEDFFPMGFEVDDFCLRLALAGWRLRIVDDCAIAHEGRGRETTAMLGYETVMQRNWACFTEKWELDATTQPSDVDFTQVVANTDMTPSIDCPIAALMAIWNHTRPFY